MFQGCRHLAGCGSGWFQMQSQSERAGEGLRQSTIPGYWWVIITPFVELWGTLMSCQSLGALGAEWFVKERLVSNLNASDTLQTVQRSEEPLKVTCGINWVNWYQSWRYLILGRLLNGSLCSQHRNWYLKKWAMTTFIAGRKWELGKCVEHTAFISPYRWVYNASFRSNVWPRLLAKQKINRLDRNVAW